MMTMPVFALYNLDDAGTTANDSAAGNGAQNGVYMNGADSDGSRVVLDGVNDIVKIYPDDSFQMDRGTLAIDFTLSGEPLDGTQTVLSRDSIGQTSGGYHIDILANGSVVISHETATGTQTFGTAAGFASPGDHISLSYSWDQTGSGGALAIDNLTDGSSFNQDVPNTLTMDMGLQNQPWIIGAGQPLSNPLQLNDIIQHFSGTVTTFSLSDTVDNCSDETDDDAHDEDEDDDHHGHDDDKDGDDDHEDDDDKDGDDDREDDDDKDGDDDHEDDDGKDGDDDREDDDDKDDDCDTPKRDGIVNGTTAGDLINAAYLGDNDGDRVDAFDALLAGDAPNDDRILAGEGNDTIFAGLGDDSVMAGTGNDYAAGGLGDDSIWGQDGNDTLIGSEGNDLLKGEDGNDYIDSRGGGVLPLPDLGYPLLYPSDLNPSNDLDTVYGGSGVDTILTGDDADVIYGGAGADVIDAGFDADTVYGDDGSDTIIGAEGSDLIDGGEGGDLIYGGYGPDVPDSVNFLDATDLRPENGRDTILGGAGNDTILGQDDDDSIDGGTGDDVIDGGIDEDVIRGDAGHDAITGGAGADVSYGGADRDTFLVGSAADGAGDQVYGGAEGDDFDSLDLTGAGRHRMVNVVTDSDGNGIDGTVEFLDTDGNVTGSLNFNNIEEVIPCFTPGTLIATPKGEVPVESLRAGDRIITRDNGIQTIRWAGQKAMSRADLAANPHLKPVLIRAGSLGNGLPERDMMVSPNHRMLVANDRTALYFDEHEVLVSAKHLITSAGVQTVDSLGTTYIHFMFDRHEVVLSNGAWTESFQPGDFPLKGMGNAQRGEIYDLFPELKTEAGLQDYAPARRTLKRHEAVLLAR